MTEHTAHTYPTTTASYIVLYCNRFTILFTQIIHKQTITKEQTLLILQYSTLKSTVVPDTSLLFLRLLTDILGLT